jgi:hypothetical protein
VANESNPGPDDAKRRQHVCQYEQDWVPEIRHESQCISELLAAEVGVVAGDPVVAGWGEDVKVVGVFEGFGHVRDVAGDDEGLAAVDVVHVLLGAFFADGETQNAGEDEDDLFVGVRVPGNDAAFLQLNAREHRLLAVDELAREKRVELLGRNGGPGEVLEAFAHGGECTAEQVVSSWWLVRRS